jgi:hypothetical protein
MPNMRLQPTVCKRGLAGTLGTRLGIGLSASLRLYTNLLTEFQHSDDEDPVSKIVHCSKLPCAGMVVGTPENDSAIPQAGFPAASLGTANARVVNWAHDESRSTISSVLQGLAQARST